MIRCIKNICCLLLVIVLVPAVASAGQIENFLNLLVSPAEGKTVFIEATCTVKAVPQFSEQRINWLNDLLKHLTFQITAGKNVQEESILVDGKPSIGFISREGIQGQEINFSFDPETIYRPQTDANILTGLSGMETEITTFSYYSELHQLLSGFYEYFTAMPDQFPDACTWSKISVQYKGYGTAVKRCAISLPEETFTSKEMTDFIDSLEPGPARDMLSHMVYSGRQRYTILLDENNKPMKINYTGRSGLSAESMRNVNVDWRCLRGEKGYKDILKLTNPAVNGNNRKNVTLTREMVIAEDETESMNASVETDFVEDRVRTRTVCKIQLGYQEDQISGNVTERTVIGGNSDLKTLQINMTGSELEEYTGTLEIAQEMNKIEKNHILIQFALSSGEESVWKAGNTVLLKEKDFTVLAQRLTRSFLKSLLSLPAEDLQFILADLPVGSLDELIKEQP